MLLAEEGAKVAVGYLRGKERAEAVRRKVRAIGQRAMTVQIDQLNPDSIETAVAHVAEEMGGLDLLVNNAAIAMGGHSVAPLEPILDKTWRGNDLEQRDVDQH